MTRDLRGPALVFASSLLTLALMAADFVSRRRGRDYF